jgi:hypothetical protein
VACADLEARSAGIAGFKMSIIETSVAASRRLQPAGMRKERASREGLANG